MTTADLSKIAGRTYPAGRRTQNLVGGASPIQAKSFCMGCVTLDPEGGQVPWHNHDQEEVYFIVSGRAEACLGEERKIVTQGQALYVPSGVFHQLTNVGPEPLIMVYVYAPAGGRGPLAPGAGGDAPQSGKRRAAAARRRPTPAGRG